VAVTPSGATRTTAFWTVRAKNSNRSTLPAMNAAISAGPAFSTILPFCRSSRSGQSGRNRSSSSAQAWRVTASPYSRCSRVIAT
jgi:hypothetical protein